MLGRINRVTGLGTTIITLSGGEPTLHPGIDTIIRRIRDRGAMATLITNGLLLSPERIQALNQAGLDYLQFSIDNVVPDDVSKKSLRVLDRKLEWLARYAEFGVTINSVLGAGVRNPEYAVVIGRRARELGFNIRRGLPNLWHCRAGGRFFYVCEEGLVHYCSQGSRSPEKLRALLRHLLCASDGDAR